MKPAYAYFIREPVGLTNLYAWKRCDRQKYVFWRRELHRTPADLLLNGIKVAKINLAAAAAATR